MNMLERRLSNLTVEDGASPTIDELAAMTSRRPLIRRVTVALSVVAAFLAIGIWFASGSADPAQVASTGGSAPEVGPYRKVSAQLLSTPSSLSATLLGDVQTLTRDDATIYPVIIDVEASSEQIETVEVEAWRLSTGETTPAIGNEQCSDNPNRVCNKTSVLVILEMGQAVVPLFFDNVLLPDGTTIAETDVTVTDAAGEVKTEVLQVEIVATDSPDGPKNEVVGTTIPR